MSDNGNGDGKVINGPWEGSGQDKPSDPESQPTMVPQLVISIEGPGQVGLKWQGLPNDAVILYGLLEIATDIVRDHFARHNAPKILVSNGPLPPFPSS